MDDFVPVKKGDYVAVEIEHFGTSSNVCDPSTASTARAAVTRWHIARVHKASKTGAVREVVLPGLTYAQPLNRLGRRAKTYTVKDYQERAANLFNSSPLDSSYDTADSIKAAILRA